MKHKGLILFIVLGVGLFLVLLSQKDRVQQAPKAVVGLEVPEFELLDKNGKLINIKDLRGKRVIVHFWASWCKECRKEMPQVVAYYDRKRNDPGFVLLSVVYRENPAESKSYLEKEGFDIPVYVDPDQNAARVFGVTGVPETYIIDPDGVLTKKIIGPTNWDNL
ncbi:MAG: TlpA family protein disulfide reductase [Nitrospirae bacterium]|nr:TlpA family protein disulfide reductase [Nitrospirota bacterium]